MVSDYQNADELKKIIVPFSAHFRSLYQLLGWQSGRVESGLKNIFLQALAMGCWRWPGYATPTR